MKKFGVYFYHRGSIQFYKTAEMAILDLDSKALEPNIKWLCDIRNEMEIGDENHTIDHINNILSPGLAKHVDGVLVADCDKDGIVQEWYISESNGEDFTPLDPIT